MNGLSWFLYLADVLPSLANTVAFPAWVVGIAAPLGAAFFWMAARDLGAPPEVKDSSDKVFKIAALKVVPLCFVLIVLTSLVPSKETIYLIAGSEASEYAVTSDYGQEILGDIKEIIKVQLEELKGDSK